MPAGQAIVLNDRQVVCPMSSGAFPATFAPLFAAMPANILLIGPVRSLHPAQGHLHGQLAAALTTRIGGRNMPKVLRSPQSERAVDAGGKAITCSLHFTEVPGLGYPLLWMNITRDADAFPATFTPSFPAGCAYDTWEMYDAGSAENPHHFTLAPAEDDRTWPLAEITAMTGWTGLDDVGSHTITTA